MAAQICHQVSPIGKADRSCHPQPLIPWPWTRASECSSDTHTCPNKTTLQPQSSPPSCWPREPVTNGLCRAHSLVPKDPTRAAPGHPSLGDAAHSMLGLSFCLGYRGSILPSSSRLHYEVSCLLASPAQGPSLQRGTAGEGHGGQGTSPHGAQSWRAGPALWKGVQPARGSGQGADPMLRPLPVHTCTDVPETAPSSHSAFSFRWLCPWLRIGSTAWPQRLRKPQLQGVGPEPELPPHPSGLQPDSSLTVWWGAIARNCSPRPHLMAVRGLCHISASVSPPHNKVECPSAIA